MAAKVFPWLGWAIAGFQQMGKQHRHVYLVCFLTKVDIDWLPSLKTLSIRFFQKYQLNGGSHWKSIRPVLSESNNAVYPEHAICFHWAIFEQFFSKSSSAGCPEHWIDIACFHWTIFNHCFSESIAAHCKWHSVRWRVLHGHEAQRYPKSGIRLKCRKTHEVATQCAQKCDCGLADSIWKSAHCKW